MVIYYTSFIRPFCSTCFLKRDERSEKCYKANKCDKMACKTNVIQLFFFPISNFKLKKSLKHNGRKFIFGKYRRLVTVVTRRTIQVLNLKCEIIT
jgi:hypothetical protein